MACEYVINSEGIFAFATGAVRWKEVIDKVGVRQPGMPDAQTK